MRSNLKLVVNNPHNQTDEKQFFEKDELKIILDLYAKMVSEGSWKDYGLSISSKQVSFSVFRNAAENALYNVLANLFNVFIVSLVSFWITSKLVRDLGSELYGVVPLFSSLNRYLGLATVVLTASVGRFVSISYFKGNLYEARQYYSSALFALIILCSVIWTFLVLLSGSLHKIIHFPQDYYTEVRVLFVMATASILISSLFFNS